MPAARAIPTAGTPLPHNLTAIPPVTEITSTSAAVVQTQVIPVTGAGTASLICQFCVDDTPFAMVLLPENATFSLGVPSGNTTNPTPASQITCTTVDTVNGKSVLACTGLKLSSFTLNVCMDGGNCTAFPVKLQDYPLSKPENSTADTDTPEARTATAEPQTGTPAAPATSQPSPLPTQTP